MLEGNMERHRYVPIPGVSFKFYHVVDRLNDAITEWDETTGLTAPDQSTSPCDEDELFNSLKNYFYRTVRSIYVPVIHRQHLKIEELKQRAEEQGGEVIQVLEIDVERITPEGQIFPVRDMIVGRKGPWVGDPREDDWMETYVILHRVPKEAITVYTPEGLLEKESNDKRQRDEVVAHQLFEQLDARQAAEGHHLNQGQDAGGTQRVEEAEQSEPPRSGIERVRKWLPRI